jgi:ADP-ribose pyrophosphatase YjhB (NUDIX family)
MSEDFAASVAIMDEGRILLARRSDVEAWSLPGGRVEAGESVVDAARREAHEETGLEVELTRLVGIYYLPHWKNGDNHDVLFAGRALSGVVQPDGKEIIEVAYFDVKSLPDPVLWWHRQRITDVLSGVCGVVRMQNVLWPFKGSLEAAREMCTAGPQTSRQDFYRLHFAPPMGSPESRQVLLVEGTRVSE